MMPAAEPRPTWQARFAQRGAGLHGVTLRLVPDTGMPAKPPRDHDRAAGPVGQEDPGTLAKPKPLPRGLIAQTRREKVLAFLTEDWTPNGEVVAHLDMPRGHVSSALGRIRKAGLIETRVTHGQWGRQSHHRLTAAGLATRRAGNVQDGPVKPSGDDAP